MIPYVNAIITPYAKVILDGKTGAILSLTGPLNTLRTIVGRDGNACLQRFDTITDMTFLGTVGGVWVKDNPICCGRTIDVIIRLTRCSDKPEERVYIDLDCFSVDLAQARRDGKLSQGSMEFYSICRLSHFPELSIRLPSSSDGPTFGLYELKVIVQERDTATPLTVQGISAVHIIGEGTSIE